MVCLNCNVRKRNAPRGLCRRCYKSDAVRLRFATLTVEDGYGLPLPYGVSRPMPPQPTDAYPGTSSKVQVLITRAALGQELWHPQDACLGSMVD